MARHILFVSYDHALLTARVKLLQQHGYKVTSADNFHDGLRLCETEIFEAAVIGHSVPLAEQRQLAKAVGDISPGVFIVTLRHLKTDDVSFADHAVDTDRPEELVSVLDGILEKRNS